MSSRGVFSVALKVCGVVLAALGVVSIPGAVESVVSFLGPMDPSKLGLCARSVAVGVVVAHPALYLAMGLFLLSSSGWLASRFVRDDEAISLPAPELWARSVFALAARVVGLVCLVNSLPGASYVVAHTAARSREEANSVGTTLFQAFREEVWREQAAAIIFSVVSLAIGVYLLTGAKGLVEALFRSRRDGPP